MNFHWLRDQTQLNKLYIYWGKLSTILADYQTKHHPPSHHIEVRPKYILKGYNIQRDSGQHFPARVCCYYGTSNSQQTNIGTHIISRY